MTPRYIFKLSLLISLFSSSCARKSEQDLHEAVRKDPDIVFNAIRDNPEKFAKVMEAAQKEKMRIDKEQREEREKETMEREFREPRVAKVEPHRVVEGPANAPIEIVQYSDFQCPFCKQGAATVSELKKKYGDRIKVVYKHLPLPFHKMAAPAAKRFEALALQDKKIALKFYAAVFGNQEKLGAGGEGLLDRLAKESGGNVKKMQSDLKAEAVRQTIIADITEAKNFGIEMTPGFVIGGVTMRGARNAKDFENIIERRLASMNSAKLSVR